MYFAFLGHIESKENFHRFIQEAKQRSMKLRSPHVYFIDSEDHYLNNTFSIVKNAATYENLGFKFSTDHMKSLRINPYDLTELQHAEGQPFVMIVPVYRMYGNLQFLKDIRSHFRLVSMQQKAA